MARAFEFVSWMERAGIAIIFPDEKVAHTDSSMPAVDDRDRSLSELRHCARFTSLAIGGVKYLT